MTTDSFGPEVIGIVRRYSEKAADAMPDSTLAQIVSASEVDRQKQENQPKLWRQWLRFDVPETDPDTKDLQSQVRETAELWRRLKLDKLDIDGTGDGPPNIDTLLNVARDAEIQWVKKKEHGFARANAHLRSFLETMEAHSYLFSIIPNGQWYSSLLTGVVSTVVKASVNNEHIAEGFSRSLQDISKDLNFVRRGTKIANTPEVKHHVLALYREVFEFLCYAMKWYSSRWNRFRTSFNENFYDKHVQERVSRIQKLVQRVRDEMNMVTDATVQRIHGEQRAGFLETNDHMDDLYEKLDLKLSMMGRNLMEELAQYMFGTLMANAQHELLDLGPEASQKMPAPQRRQLSGLELPPKIDVRQFLEEIDPYAENGKESLVLSLDSATIPSIPNEVILDLQGWITSRESKLLWIEGPAYGPFDDILSRIGLRVCASAETIGIPCINFFAKLKYSFQTKETEMQRAALVAMVYSLISQLIAILRAELQPQAFQDLCDEELETLDSTPRSISAALRILKALVVSVPPGLICVLSGFDLVDSRENLSPLCEFIRILRDQPAEKSVKVLFISKGNCRSLSSETNIRQWSDATRMVLGRGSSVLSGGSTAEDIDMF